MFYHVTTSRGLRGIRKDGFIDPNMATGKRPYSWFVPLFKVDWAILHVQARHCVTLDEVVILEIDLEPAYFSEHAGSAKYFRTLKTETTFVRGVWNAPAWIKRDEPVDAGCFEDARR